MNLKSIIVIAAGALAAIVAAGDGAEACGTIKTGRDHGPAIAHEVNITLTLLYLQDAD